MGQSYQARVVSSNGIGLPTSGGIIKEEHINDEFTQLIAAFNASTGHTHDGSDSTRVATLGTNQQLQTTATSIFPGTATIDLGTTGAKFRDAFISANIKVDNSGSVWTSTIRDASGNEAIKLTATGSATNELGVVNAANGDNVKIVTTGDSDTNVNIELDPKGSGKVVIGDGTLQLNTTPITATGAEINLLDGSVATVGTTAVAGGDGIVTKDLDATTTRLTSLDTFDTYLSQTVKTLENKTLTTPTLTSPVINTSVSGDAIDTDLTSVSGSDDTLASAKAIKTYVDAQILTKDNTDEITEGSSNLYFTNARADARITAVLQDDDAFGSPSATNIASSESIKAYVDAQKADMQFFLEDGAGAEVAITRDKEVKFVEGGGIDIEWTDTDNGTDADPYDLTFTVTGLDTTHLDSNILDTDLTAVAGTDTTLASAKAIKTYVDAQVGGITSPVTLTNTVTLENKRLTSPKINEDVVLSATATELNLLNGTFVGSAVAGKAVVLDTGSGNFINDLGCFKTQGFIDQGEYNSLSAGTHTLDWTNHGYLVVLLTGDVTLVMGLPALVGGTGSESGVNAAAYCTLKVVQDGTGGRSITWPSSTVLKWPGGVAPTLTGTANSCDVFTFFCQDTAANGSLGDWYGFTAGFNVS